MGNQRWRLCWKLRKERQPGEGTGLKVEARHRQTERNRVPGESCGRQLHAGQGRAEVYVDGKGCNRLCLRGHPDSQSLSEAGLHVGSASKEFPSCAACPRLQYRSD